GEPVHCSLENGHCVASLTRRHRLWINIEFECPIIFMNEVTDLTNIVVNIDDLVRSHGVGDALHINVSALLTADRVFDKNVGLIRDKNLVRRSRLFEPGRKIYTAADNAVVHSDLATEVSDGTETSVNSSSTTWRFFYTRGSPDAIQFAHSLAHGDRHLYACHRIRLNAFGVWVAEEDEDGVADVLVDRPTKLKSDLRHLSQIMVQELRQILGFEPFSRLREAFEVGEEDR